MNMADETAFFNRQAAGLTDCHLHTGYSFDAEVPVADMLARAEALGLAACCITDHCEMNDPDLLTLERQMKGSVAEVERLRKTRFSGSGTVFLTGLELGQATQNLPEAERFLREIPVDFVIGSLHNLAGEEDFYFLHYTPENVPDYLERYFDELLALTKWGKFDSLGHLTYPLRYMVGKYHIRPDMSRYREKIDAILQTLAESGKALEINTSGLRNEIGETAPTIEYVKRFRALGGQYITIGSDAHDTESLGKGLREAAEMALEAGFPGITYFVKHQPVTVFVPPRQWQ